ncbi:S41 family peptidase [Algoriphagus halophytocola]|uniref:S41 family peptidase n=1 Tax=Algoriphagus halophytocola TaxID=2991499 RepID=A0ABY6MHF2_9BACT|nr:MULTISPECIES: S41 family peptidase [unclassified Algoriphagus]UZD22450.1 S41 family peptidase [Algoriphagus sp. TR-M5]WBL43710.1 S41 family peptidase [Algoriphagus sp. TR-M9]
MKSNQILKACFYVILSGLLWSCDKDDEMDPVVEPPVVPENTLETEINGWIRAVMNEVYYWNENMRTPIAATSEPEDYYESLLFRPTDRFSAIYPDYQELINNLSGISLDAGYEYTLYRASSTSDDVVAEISYVKKNSPAATEGLRRGDVITAINGTVMNIDNYRTVLGRTESTHTISYIRFNESEGGYQAQADISLTPVQLSENPIFLDTVFNVDSEKIGYVIYNFFAPDAGNGDKAFDNELDAAFASFKAQQINHLIVDFRYNGGGLVSSAVNMASLIAPAVTDEDIFSKTKYNDFISTNIPELSNVQTAFKTKAENLGATLEGNRVYIITSSRTASASELIINGLRPYMDVFLVGDVTYGKNVGSIPFEDEENDDNNYGLLPIVTRSFNSLDESDYINGFEPNVEAFEYEERLRPLGDINEYLLRTTIEQITGTASSARIEKLDRVDIGSTLDNKIRQGRMIESNPFK